MVAIKLGISNRGKAPDFYRRVSVEASDAGIDKLKRQAVLLFQENGNSDVSVVDLSGFSVTLFHMDSDGDRVLICNETDLVEAIGEGKDEISAVIKVHAVVKPIVHPVSTRSTQTFAPSTSETGTQPSPATMVDALADLVHSVAVTAQAGVEAASQAAQEVQRDQQKALQAEARKNLKTAKVQLKQAKRVMKEPIRNATRGVHQSVRAAKASAKTSKDALKKTIMDQQNVVAREMNDLAAKVSSAVAEANSTSIQFIHGRHTCDLCLTSPIIGKRFHATNLPDYDLCGACHDNYQGNDITFAESVLDRDRGMQKRWQHKYARMVQINRPGGHRGGGKPQRVVRRGPPHFPHHGPFGQRFGPPPHAPPCVPTRSHSPPSAPLEPVPFPPLSHQPPRVTTPPHNPYATARSVDSPFDLAMKEAVRRSLEEANTTTPESKEETVDTKAEVAEAKVQVTTVASDDEESIEDDDEESVEDDDEVTYDTEEDVVSEQTEAPEDEEAQPELADIEEKKVFIEDADITKDAEAATNEPLPCVQVQAGQKPTDSFSSDALDSGSVAQFMGETLDRFSEAIDSLNSEVGGATIVDGEPHEEDDDSSKDSWSVVEDEQIAHDASLARAAVTLGSALFNSDNNIASGTSTGSVSQMSSITSAPSSLPSIVQTQRWSAQLEQLHELGFHDDVKYIEVMEMLAAANIGSGEEDEITVTQVLDHTM